MAEKLEELVVELNGDGSGYRRMLDQATVALSSFVGAWGGASWLKEGLHNFEEAELIGLRLSAVLESQGRDVKALTADYQDFAKEMERTTTAEDDAILKTLAMAEALGVTGAAAKRATRNAEALAAMYGGTSESYIRQTALLEKGHVGRLAMILGLRDEGDEAAKVAKAQDTLGKMYSLVEAKTKSHAGQVEILRRDYGNLLEDFGKVTAEGVAPLIQKATELVAVVRGLSDGQKSAIAIAAMVAVGLLGLVTAATAAAFAYNQLSTALAGYTAKQAAANAAALQGRAAMLGVALVMVGVLQEEGALIERMLGNAEKMRKINDEIRGMGRGEQREAQVDISVAGDDPEKLDQLKKRYEDQLAVLRQHRKEIDTTGLALARNVPMTTELTRAMIKDWEETAESIRVAEQALEQVKDKQARLQAEAAKGDGAGGAWAKNMAEGIVRAKQLGESYKELRDRLTDEIEARGKSAEQAALDKMFRQGLGQDQAEEIQRLIELKKAQEELAKKQEEGKRVTEQYRTPQEVYADQVKRLNDLLTAGTITQETYNRAVADARGKLEEAGKAGRTAAAEVLRFDAARTGSSDALFKREQYRAMVSVNSSNRGSDPVPILKKIEEHTREANKAPKIVLKAAGFQG